MDLLSMVMEARKKQPAPPRGNVITDEPTEDERVNDYMDDGEDEGDENDATPDDVDYGTDDGDIISDEPADGDDDDVDYGAEDPYAEPETAPNDPDAGGQGEGDRPEDAGPDDPGAEGENPPAGGPAEGEEGQGGNVISDQPGNDQGGGTDYGEGMPGGEDEGDQAPPQEQQEGNPNQGQQPPQEGEEAPPAEGEQPPEGEEGQEGNGDEAPPEGEENPEADGPSVDEPAEKNEAREVANMVLLLRAFNRLHSDIRKFSKRVADAKHRSILASVVYKQVINNLNELRDMVYKYILLSFDSSTYDENRYNYEYFIEIMDWNLSMIEKINEITKSAEEGKKDKK